MRRLASGLAISLLSAACLSGARADPGPLPAPKADLPKAKGPQTAVFAAGCFWCVEAVFERVEGVTDVVSGYAGDAQAKADYKLVSAGRTQHAEAVRVTYDPAKVSYGALLHILFTTHDPTTKDRQGPDRGHQYRSAIFYSSEAEKEVAAAYIAQLDAAKIFDAKIVTTLEPLSEFYPAEDYHQDFVAQHPNHGYVRAWSVPKIEKLEKRFPDRLK
jgi:peptide-methionine (S)-S-oxide reductase